MKIVTRIALAIAFVLVAGTPVSRALAEEGSHENCGKSLQQVATCLEESHPRWMNWTLAKGLETMKKRSPEFSQWWDESGLKTSDSHAPGVVMSWWSMQPAKGEAACPVHASNRGLGHLLGSAFNDLGACKPAVSEGDAATKTTCFECMSMFGDCWFCWPDPCRTCN